MTSRVSTLLAVLTLSAAPAACLFEPDRLGPLEEPTDTGTGDTGTGDTGTNTDGSLDEASDSSGAIPEDAESSTGDVNAACFEVDEPCTQGADCCDFDPAFPPGSSQCVQLESQAQCTTICFGPDDCDSGCCAALEGISAYGACVSASQCSDG